MVDIDPSQKPKTARNKALVQLEDLTLLQAGRPVFEHTNWTIQHGQHWAIVGDGRSGASILASALSREIPILSGRISFFPGSDPNPTGRSYFERGEVITVSPGSYDAIMRQYAGYQQARWQSFEGGECPTAGELLTGKSIEHRSPYQVDAQQIDESLYRQRRHRATRLLGIEHLLDRKILHLSTGERRKVLIARALMQEPDLLVLDDPCGGLDAESRARLLQHLAELLQHDNSPTIVLVAARADEVPDGIDHFAVVQDKALIHTTSRSGYELWINTGKPNSPRKQMETRPVFPAPIRNDWKTFRESNTPLISITGATIRYGNKTVLDNIDWTVHAGEHWAIVGPNGAGKSTLLSLVLGDCPQSYAQNIRLWGRRRGTGESIWDLRKNIGFVCSESHTFHPPEADCLSTVLSGFHETIGLYKFCAKSEHDHAFRWMQSLGIEKLASRPFGELSLGEQRLVLLARALVRDPVLLILDEICQSLGEESRAAILRILEQLCQHDLPLSLICVSHHWDEIPDSVRYRMHMKNGLIMKSK